MAAIVLPNRTSFPLSSSLERLIARVFSPAFGRSFQAAFAAPAVAAGPVTQVFQCSKDNNFNSAFTNRNHGISAVLFAAGGLQRAILFFDVSSIAAGKTCNSAVLKLYKTGTGAASARTITVYSIAVGNSGWPEGTKDNAVGGAGDSCHLYKDQTPGSEVAWAGSVGMGTSGTDYEVPALGSIGANYGDPIGTEYQIALTAARIQGWFGATNTNYGLLVVLSSAFNGVGSRHHATVGYRPTLTIISQ